MKQTNDERAGRRLILKSLAAAPLAALASACELPVPGQGPPPILYRLTPKSTFSEDLPTVNWQLVVEAPVANAGLNTTRITRRSTATQLEYFASSNWIDRAPLMVQTLMIESFENSGRIISVGREAVGLQADFVLKTELREFQADYYETNPPTVLVGINAKLVMMPFRRIIGSKSFMHEVKANKDDMADIVPAFDEALGKVLKRIVEWTLVNGEAADRKRTSS
jgi:cholesterol transport system auxiliary component